MIELTEHQAEAVETSGEMPPTVLNPRTRNVYVLIRKEWYDKLMSKEYDDSPWTDEEMELLAWEAGQEAGWEEMDEYDRYPEKP